MSLKEGSVWPIEEALTADFKRFLPPNEAADWARFIISSGLGRAGDSMSYINPSDLCRMREATQAFNKYVEQYCIDLVNKAYNPLFEGDPSVTASPFSAEISAFQKFLVHRRNYPAYYILDRNTKLRIVLITAILGLLGASALLKEKMKDE